MKRILVALALMATVSTAGAQAPASTDPFSAYTVCMTAAYAELIGRFSNPAESMVRARIACKKVRAALEADVRKRAGASTAEVLLGIDAELLRTLRN